jgi:hypothetical protein
MPHYLGTAPHGHTSTTWTTAHGDFHYANLCGPDLYILDWEGWGTAPAGYDAATLHSHSLLIPTVAARIREQFADLLAKPLRQRAASILGHPVRPSATAHPDTDHHHDRTTASAGPGAPHPDPTLVQQTTSYGN